MLREFRASDADALYPLLVRNFPEEDALLGWEPASLHQIVRRFYRWDARLVLGLLRLIRRPVFRFFVIDVEGKPAATTTLVFAAKSGYVGAVMVDAPFRGRGFARRLLEAAMQATRAAGKPFLVLDVLADNAPARALYASLGFERLRSQAYFLREGGTSPSLDAGAEARSRPLRPADRKPLAALASGALPPKVAEVLPVRPRDFHVPPVVVAGLESETEAWVAPAEPPAAAFIRATVSRAMTSANLTAPLVGERVSDDEAFALVQRAVRWVGEHGRSRIVTELPDHNARGRVLLERTGFHAAYQIETLYRPL